MTGFISLKNRRSLPKVADKTADYIPAEDCIGMEFSSTSFRFRVDEYLPREGVFLCTPLNCGGGQHKKSALYVRSRCTPVEQIQYEEKFVPERDTPSAATYPQFPKIPFEPPQLPVQSERSVTTVTVLDEEAMDATPYINQEFIIGNRRYKVLRHAPNRQVFLVSVLNRYVWTSEAFVTTHVASNTPSAGTAALSASPAEDVTPHHYVDQTFTHGTRTYRVVRYKEHRDQFTLVADGWYSHREAQFVYDFCTPADQPVDHTQTETIMATAQQISKRISIAKITGVIGASSDPRPAAEVDTFDWYSLIGDNTMRLQEITYAPTQRGTARWTGQVHVAGGYLVDVELWQEDIDHLNQVLSINIGEGDYTHDTHITFEPRFVDAKRKRLKGVGGVFNGTTYVYVVDLKKEGVS